MFRRQPREPRERWLGAKGLEGGLTGDIQAAPGGWPSRKDRPESDGGGIKLEMPQNFLTLYWATQEAVE